MFAETLTWPARRALPPSLLFGCNKRISAVVLLQTRQCTLSSPATKERDYHDNVATTGSTESSSSSSATEEYDSRILSYFRGAHANLVSSFSGLSATTHRRSDSWPTTRNSRSMVDTGEISLRTELPRNRKVKDSSRRQNLDESTNKVLRNRRRTDDAPEDTRAEKSPKIERATKRSVTRNVSDTHLPTTMKRPSSAYMLFVADNRERLLKEVDEAYGVSASKAGSTLVGMKDEKGKKCERGRFSYREYTTQAYLALDADTKQTYIDKAKVLLAKWSERRTAQLRKLSAKELEAINLVRKKHGLSKIKKPRASTPKPPLNGYQRFYADYKTRSTSTPTKQATQKSKSTSQPEDPYAFRRECASAWLSMGPEEREPWNGPARRDRLLWKAKLKLAE